MKPVLNPDPSISSIPAAKPRNSPLLNLRTCLRFPAKHGDRWIERNRLVSKAVLNSTTADELGISEPEFLNPTVSSSYRDPKLRRPNQTVLDAQARVCTGPTQTRPLSEEQAFKVLDTIVRSAKGECRGEEQEVSKAQLGAFFAAMTIRANSFPEATQWSEGERRAMNKYWPFLIKTLPPDIIFIADPEGSIMGVGSSIGPHYVGNGSPEMRLVGALREVLAGGHLGYEEVQGVLKDVLPLKMEDETTANVSESLLAAFLIGQRMNRETDRELKAYCLAFDDEFGSAPIADVGSLTHYGEPYDGNTRFFRSTLFVAAVRSCYGESCLLHGMDWMPPKGGITEEQMLKFMGANICLSPLQAKNAALSLSVSETSSPPPPNRKTSPILPPWVDGAAKSPKTIGSTETTAQVHPQLFTRKLLSKAVESYGVEVVIGKAESVVVDGGVARSVVLDGGTAIEADAVVLALGPWTSKLPLLSSIFRVYGLKVHSIVLEPKDPDSISPHALFLSYYPAQGGKPMDPEVYPRPTGEVYLCGTSVEADVPDDPETVEPDPVSIRVLKRVAKSVSSHLEEGESTVKAEQACFLPCTDDSVPVIGEVPGVKGCYVATGHSCWGILNGPATGAAVAELVVDGCAAIVDLAPFSPLRFVGIGSALS